MKTLLIPVLFGLLSACNGSNSTHENSDHENPDLLKHIKQELVAPPFLPKYEQAVTGDPVVV
ncbi:MAG: hypothetical protein ACYC1Q_09465, partial [Bacteroidia bacterium]